MAVVSLYGVVEGFYGKPWTWRQRNKLFQQLKTYNLNSFMYAPKDDLKHRAYWKIPYTKEECVLLKDLIDSANEKGIIFIYAISPGVDITYSDPNDVALLKAKLNQILSLGCTAWALLFDDLEPPKLKPEDASIFRNFAEAQCTVTMEIYEHFKRPPVFLFCPTEYCATRAVPNVKQSVYLKTCGRMLHPDIHIFWTGPNVISRHLTAEGLVELADVIARKPTIWDNLHANDYDRQRIYLGPYDRDPNEVIPFVRGILINPNCEFDANFIPLHTFQSWYRHFKENELLMQRVTFCPNTLLGLAVQAWVVEWNLNEQGLIAVPSLDEAKCDEVMDIDETNIPGYQSVREVAPDDVQVLVDLFFLPFSHGRIAAEMIDDFRWLRINAAIKRFHGPNFEHDKNNTPTKIEWEERMVRFDENYEAVQKMCNNLSRCVNRALLYDIYPYFYDLKSILSVIRSFLKWTLDAEETSSASEWYENDQRAEPWFRRGGVTGDLQRLLPLDVRSNDLFSLVPCDPHQSKIYTIRPFLHDDKDEVYRVCAACYSTTDFGRVLLPNFPDAGDVLCDALIGYFLQPAPSRMICFLGCYSDSAVNNEIVNGYVLAASNANLFRTNAQPYFESLARQYVNYSLEKSLANSACDATRMSNSLTDLVAVQKIAEFFKTLCCGCILPDDISKVYPSLISLARCDDGNATKRLLTCALSALKSKNSSGYHVVTHRLNPHMKQICIDMKFDEIFKTHVDVEIPIGVAGTTSSVTPENKPAPWIQMKKENMEVVIYGRSM